MKEKNPISTVTFGKPDNGEVKFHMRVALLVVWIQQGMDHLWNLMLFPPNRYVFLQKRASNSSNIHTLIFSFFSVLLTLTKEQSEFEQTLATGIKNTAGLGSTTGSAACHGWGRSQSGNIHAQGNSCAWVRACGIVHPWYRCLSCPHILSHLCSSRIWLN